MGLLEPLSNYQKTDPKVLLHYADQLFQSNTFHQYLTPPQLIVLNKVLTIQDPSHKEKVWMELINSNVSLDVVKKVEPVLEEALTNSGSAEAASPSVHSDGPNRKQDRSQDQNLNIAGNETKNTSAANPNNSNEDQSASPTDGVPQETNSLQDGIFGNQNDEQNGDTVKKEADPLMEPDFSEVDLENLQQQMSGTEFIGNLSLKLRYVLWESAIEPLCDAEQGNKNVDLPFSQAVSMDAEEPLSKPEASSHLDSRNKEEDDDYDDEDDGEQENVDETPNNDTKSDPSSAEAVYDQFGRLILVLEISKDTLSALGVNDTQAIIENFNKIYHNFENDRETLMKRLKLEESDKLLEPSKKRRHHELSESVDKEGDNSSDDEEAVKKVKPQDVHMSAISVNLGSANLSLKHLLASIQENKTKLDISDYELRHLIMDVRKNRSKWASDDKIGQEELYDACEKVVLELRNYTEHSTAFLNKVSKREAPNYYQVIKKPMDLNTVLKKLKTFQYNSKQEFVDDVLLIWKNCLTYNSDPKHFLRTHAIAMQKKSLSLIPLIPDITVRDRSEVEKELEDIDKENGKDGDVEEEEASGTGRKGGNVRGLKHAPGEKSAKTTDHMSGLKSQGSPEETTSKGLKGQKATSSKDDTLNEELESQRDVNMDAQSSDETTHQNNGKTSLLDDASQQNAPSKGVKIEEDNLEKVDNEEEATKDREDEDEEEEDEEDEDGESNMYLVEKDDDKDDLELSTWKSCTATVRADLCIKRANLFQGHCLNNKAPAILRNPSKMKEFDQFVKEYKEQQEAELQRRKLEQESIMKNGFGTVMKQEDDENVASQQQQQQSNMSSENDVDKQSTEIEIDDANFLTEYNVANSVPAIAYKGIDEVVVDEEESMLVESVLATGNMQHSDFLANREKGLNPKINGNIQLIQEIRHICHKIALIRMLQNPQNPSQQIKNGTNNANNQIWDTHKYKFTCIDDELDLDPVSRLPTRNQKHDKKLMWRLMHKNVSKIAMSNGFESTQPVATNMLTEIAGEYLSNIIKTIKIHHESTSLNPKSSYEILQMALLENGINKPDDLYSYIEAEFVKKNNKLRDIKFKLNNFLKDLLRPTLQDLSERNFEDESQSFMTGDFSSEITGEDFFGFKDLGLDREFGVLSNSVPLQLLTFQFQGKGSEAKVQDKKIQPEEFNDVVYSDVATSSIKEGKYWKTLQPLLEKALNRFKVQSLKNNKQRPPESVSPKAEQDLFEVLPEDDEMPSKSKSSGKPRLPPTGKINTNYKKKPVADAFFAPDLPPSQVAIKTEKPDQPNSEPLVDSMDSRRLSAANSVDNTSPETFTLSLPKVSD